MTEIPRREKDGTISRDNTMSRVPAVMRDVIRLKLQRTVPKHNTAFTIASVPLNSLNIHHQCTLLNNLGQYE